MSNAIFDVELKKINGEKTTLGEFKGSVLLVVNVASECGLTKQYDGLEKLYEEFLGAQEPGTEEEIHSFCTTQFGVKFPMFSKLEVNGENRHPLYKALISAQPKALEPEGSEFLARMTSKGRAPAQPGNILWNFEKFLVSRDGEVIQRFAPDMTPEDAQLVSAVKQALTK